MGLRCRIAITSLNIFLIFSYARNSIAQSSSQSSSLTYTVTRDPLALERLAACHKALGGATSESSWTAQGTSGTASAQTLYMFQMRGPSYHKIIQSFQGHTATLVSAGGESRLTRGSKVQRPTSSSTHYPKPALVPIYLCSVEAMSDHLSIETVGLEAKSGLTLMHIAIFADALDADGKEDNFEKMVSRTDLYLDPSTNLPRLADFITLPLESPGSMFHAELVYQDYQPVGSGMLPFTVTQRLATRDVKTITWSQISPSADIPMSDFELEAVR